MLANIAVPLCGRVPVNLNYTVSSEVMNSCIRQAEIKHVLTSRKVLERFNLDIHAELVFLEDFKDKVTTMDKIVAAFQAFVCPMPILERMLGVDKIKDDDLLTMIFTSGSTGEPKGVMLTQRNVASNVECVDYLLQLNPRIAWRASCRFSIRPGSRPRCGRRSRSIQRGPITPARSRPGKWARCAARKR